MSNINLLFESAIGFALFELVKADEVGIQLAEVQSSINNLDKFSKIVKLKSFLPFKSAESALENINAIAEGEMTKYLADWLEANVRSPLELGVIDQKLAHTISSTLNIQCRSNDLILELERGVRQHFVRYLKGVSSSDLAQAQLGLCHSYSRSKVQFNVHKLDSMIIQAIALVDQLEKDVNQVSMRAREWYGLHFPELGKITPTNHMFCRVAQLIGDRASIKHKNDITTQLNDITQDESITERILDASKISMGTELTDLDWLLVNGFLQRVESLHQYRENISQYLTNKMTHVAPNFTALMGEIIGARLIAKAGSLTNLAKAPASTVQIMGAEKAHFRAMKARSGKTPKYGTIFNSSFIGRASAKDKARIARTLANKASIAARIDCFSDDTSESSIYGEELKRQVEERLEFYKNGTAPRKNRVAMDAAKTAFNNGTSSSNMDDTTATTTKKVKKESSMNDDGDVMVSLKAETSAKKEKKSKKEKA